MPVQNLDNNIQIDFDIRTADTVEVEADVIIENAPTIDGEYTMPLLQMSPVITSISRNGEVLPIVNKNVNIIVPVKTSELDNDSGYTTSTYVDNSIDAHNNSTSAHQFIQNQITTITNKIPEQASSSNQLADKNFVNSSVATNTAYFLATLDIIDDLHLTYDATMLQVVVALNDYEFTSIKTNNDYCNVITQDNVGNILFERFKWNSQEETFKYEFSLNNSSFTAVQWEAINSNATAENIAQIAQNVLAISALQSDVAGKVSKSGDTMTGDLTFDTITKGIIIKSNDGTKAFRIASTGTYFSIDLVQDYDTDSPRYARVFGFPTNSLIAEMANGLYLGSRTADNKAAKISDIDNKLANYLPLDGGTITGDIIFQGQPSTQQYIKFFKDDANLYSYAIRNPHSGGQLDIGLWSRSRNSYTEGIRFGYRNAASKVTLNIIGGLLYGGDTNDENTRYQMRSDIFKQGVVSQTQTWSGSASTGYSYTMSNPVTGNIPIHFIELVEELGAIFNETSGYFEINGLTDVSYNEMKKIYTMSGANISSNNWTGIFRESPLRTNIFNYPTGTSFGNCTMSNMFAYSDIEVANIIPLTQLSEWTTDDIDGANSFIQYLGSSGYIYPASTTSGNVFRNNERLKHIRGIIRYADSSTNFTNMFNLCYSLETVWLYQHNHNTDFSWSPNLKLDTIQFIVNKRSTASTASSFTITLHPTTYATAQADTTEYTYSGNTYVGIIAYAAARDISIASA